MLVMNIMHAVNSKGCMLLPTHSTQDRMHAGEFLVYSILAIYVRIVKMKINYSFFQQE